MKMSVAQELMRGCVSGFVVKFDRKDGGRYHDDYFPEVRDGEVPIATEEAAWDLAKAFAEAMGSARVSTVHVARASDLKPVPGYVHRTLLRESS